MKHLKTTVLGAVLGLGAAAAFAAGNHAGGHGKEHGGGHGHGAAVGVPGDKNKVDRTIHVSMTDDMRFNPATIEVKQNETIRFHVMNDGKVRHEMVIGTEQELKDHYVEMMKHPEMEHDDPNQITLDGGKSGEMVWKFTKAGKVDFACLQPGHYDAGMKGKVAVAKTGSRTSAAKTSSQHSH